MAQNTRQDQPANRATSCPMEGFCRFIKSDTRSYRAISQQHGPICDEVTQVLCHGKRVCCIALSLASAQSGLCWASFWPRQCLGSKDAILILLA